MKKFLFFLLLTYITCAIIEKYESDENLEINLEGINVGSMWNKVKRNVKQAKAFLKSIGLYDPLMTLLKTAATAVAVSYCTGHGVPYPICTSIVGFLMSLIK